MSTVAGIRIRYVGWPLDVSNSPTSTGKKIGITYSNLICDGRKNCVTRQNFFTRIFSRPNRPIQTGRRTTRSRRCQMIILSAGKHETYYKTGTRYAVMVLCIWRSSAVVVTRNIVIYIYNILSAFRRFIWFGSLYLGCAGGPLVINTEQTKTNGVRGRGENIIQPSEKEKRRNFPWNNVIIIYT